MAATGVVRVAEEVLVVDDGALFPATEYETVGLAVDVVPDAVVA